MTYLIPTFSHQTLLIDSSKMLSNFYLTEKPCEFLITIDREETQQDSEKILLNKIELLSSQNFSSKIYGRITQIFLIFATYVFLPGGMIWNVLKLIGAITWHKAANEVLETYRTKNDKKMIKIINNINQIRTKRIESKICRIDEEIKRIQKIIIDDGESVTIYTGELAQLNLVKTQFSLKSIAGFPN